MPKAKPRCGLSARMHLKRGRMITLIATFSVLALVAGGMYAPAISRHLKVLRSAGLIYREVRGTQRIYSVRPEALRRIADWTMDHRDFWGNPTSVLSTVFADRVEETGGSNPVPGYTLVNTPDKAAVRLAQGCLFLEDGGSVEVVEAMER